VCILGSVLAVSLIDVGNKVVVDVVCDIVIVAVADIGVGVSGRSVVEYLIVVDFVGIAVAVLRMFLVSVDFVAVSVAVDNGVDSYDETAVSIFADTVDTVCNVGVGLSIVFDIAVCSAAVDSIVVDLKAIVGVVVVFFATAAGVSLNA
jgi:hypothetical protein